MAKGERFQFKKIHLPKLKTWQLLIILLLLLFIDATLLRLNHIKMTELRDAVLAADESGDETALSDNLEALKDFVFHNIVINVIDNNGAREVTFGTGPFYLEHQYIRAANHALEEAEHIIASDQNPYGNVYRAASEVCQPQAIANGWTWNDPHFINCMTSEIQKYPASEELSNTIAAALPSTELYRKNFASPVWAPSLAGWLIIITLVLVVVIFIRVIIWFILRLSLLFL